MSFQFLEGLNETKLSPSTFIRERTISSMDCKEYKSKIFPETPRIRPQQAPDIPIIELTLPPISEEIMEEDINKERTCQFSLNSQQYQQASLFYEMSTDNDSSSTQSVMNLGSPLSEAPSKSHSKFNSKIKKCKSLKSPKQNRNRAESVALPRFSIYKFLKKIIRKQKNHRF